MVQSFFFYDLETGGFSPRSARIMQFAGQRTDLDLKPIGQPFNELIKLTPDILPDPEALIVTGITPQQTLKDGLSEAEFLAKFHKQVVEPGTIFVGYNSVRFDDEFMRYLHYRNFYDPYEWEWQDGRSRWDLLDVVRLTRALRPDGIKWPFAPDGKPSNRLELLATVNKLDHANAHDALSDVMATIDLARLIKDRQPKLFEFLLELRDKKKVAELVNAVETFDSAQAKPFVYTSGKYPGEFEKTTVAVKLANDISGQGALVYDLHFDPDDFTKLSPEELAEIWKWQKDPEAKRLPVKTIKFNRCPAIAPLTVLDAASQKRIKLDQKTWKANLAKLRKAKDFEAKLREAQKLMEKQRQTSWVVDEQDVDAQLYEGFFDEHDRRNLLTVRTTKASELTGLSAHLHDQRLKSLLPLYKARNFPDSLTSNEQKTWQEYCEHKLQATFVQFKARLKALIEADNLTNSQRQTLAKLQSYVSNMGLAPALVESDNQKAGD
jgi:exodeoxyribonuclease-1